VLASLFAQRAAVGYDSSAQSEAQNALTATEKEKDAAVEAHHAAKLLEQKLNSDATTARELARATSDDICALQDTSEAYRQQERLATLLNAFRDRYFQYNTEAISQRATELILQAITDGSIHRIEFSANHELWYRDASYALQPVSRLSGGEKAVVGVCLRIALAEQALQVSQSGRMRFLILDEVLGSLDEERLEAMQTVFDSVQQTGFFEHVIMVTHLESVKQNWQGSRLNVRKVDTKSSSAEFMDDLVASGANE
jgi:DNA repair exonuclease SbcCD ATPase subunit